MSKKKDSKKAGKNKVDISDFFGENKPVDTGAPVEIDLTLGRAGVVGGAVANLGADAGLLGSLSSKKKKPTLERTFNQNVGGRLGFGNGKGAGRSFGKGSGEGRGPGAHIGKVGGSKNKEK